MQTKLLTADVHRITQADDKTYSQQDIQAVCTQPTVSTLPKYVYKQLMQRHGCWWTLLLCGHQRSEDGREMAVSKV